MKPFNVMLSDEDREKLEAHRVRLGLRSHAEVVRHWIALPPDSAALVSQAQERQAEVSARIAETRESIARGARPAGRRFNLNVGPEPVVPGSRLKKK